MLDIRKTNVLQLLVQMASHTLTLDPVYIAAAHVTSDSQDEMHKGWFCFAVEEVTQNTCQPTSCHWVTVLRTELELVTSWNQQLSLCEASLILLLFPAPNPALWPKIKMLYCHYTGVQWNVVQRSSLSACRRQTFRCCIAVLNERMNGHVQTNSSM